MTKIIELTDTEIQEIKAKFPLSAPKRFKVMGGSIILNYCDTKEEATLEVEQWGARDNLSSDIEDFIDEMLEKYSVWLENDEIRSTIKEF